MKTDFLQLMPAFLVKSALYVVNSNNDSDFAPFTPDFDQANELATKELAKFKYQRDDSLLNRIFEWLKELFFAIFQKKPGELSFSEILTFLFFLLIFGILIYFAVRFGLKLRKNKSQIVSNISQDQPFLDHNRTSAELFMLATIAAKNGDLNTAVLERFRGIMKSLDERGIIVLSPGLTAIEATKLAIQKIGEKQLFTTAVNWFNAILYGSAEANSAAVDSIQKLISITNNYQVSPTESTANFTASSKSFHKNKNYPEK